jgi:hypothetical protein
LQYTDMSIAVYFQPTQMGFILERQVKRQSSVLGLRLYK